MTEQQLQMHIRREAQSPVDHLITGGVNTDELAALRQGQPDTALAVQGHAVWPTLLLNIDFVHESATSKYHLSLKDGSWDSHQRLHQTMSAVESC